VLARWGGDQFAVMILDLASRDAAMNVASLLRGELRSPFDLRRHRLVVAATMGVTWADSGQQRAEDVVREANIALSAAKQHETAKILGYAPNMAGQAANLVSLEADLHVASERHELQLLFQPIVNLHTYKMVGAEALLRWRHPVEGVLAPDRFLGIAEETGLMVPITHWIILRAVRVAEEWRRRLPANQEFFISVNLSPTALRDPDLSQYVASLLRETQLPPSLLKFELTEAALISNVGAARETLDQLHGLGVQLMLDDFGTGYSSLSYLQLFPFDFVKIDRPFVNLMASDQANTGMTAAMLQMAGSLNLTAIAEIVETEEAAQALQAMGCDYAQGYYFSEPIEAEPALQLLRSGQPFQPRPESSATLKIRPLEEDGSPTIRMRIDEDQPEQETSPTAKIPPLEEDGSATIKTRVDQQVDQPPQEPSGTVKLPPLEEDGSPTIETQVDQDQPAQEPSPTVKIRPLDEDGSPTIMIPAAQHDLQASRWTSATVKLRPLEEDGSPAVRLAEDPTEEPQLKGARRR
jgi:EAL domain-containing protein (putative c-di-GMP-specific phosphodiesterase class I)